ncbi:MAG: extracellular solute-binding protein [Candidatus Pacebacteria bacterium]|nr:extracellular solute-binding protein [Candidatus Paceibacterota bacterium]
MSKFQIALYGAIGALVLLSFLVLSGILPWLPGQSSEPPADLTMWGVFSEDSWGRIIDAVNSENQKSFSIKYYEKDPATYETELVNAIASGTGPDLWFLPQDLLLKHGSKAFFIPYESLSERTFRDTFVDSGFLFMKKDGIAGMPFCVDPLVLYWNKDIFSKAAIANPSATWDGFLNQSRAMTEKDESGNILKSGGAMGEFSNIKNAKEVFSLLLLQTGNKIIDPETNKLSFGERGDSSVDPAASALNFFTSFSNPTKISYSWNRALPEDIDFFVSGKLAVYFGYASEAREIVRKNPHLNFDVYQVPQVKDSATQSTFGRVYVMAVSKSTANASKAFLAASVFSSDEVQKMIEENLYLPPVKRALLSSGQGVEDNPFMETFYKAAIRSKSWLEPDPSAVSLIFKNMVDSVVSGKKNVSSAIRDAKILLAEEMDKLE